MTTINIITDDNLDKLRDYENFTQERVDSLTTADEVKHAEEIAYHRGANHAFEDAIAFIEVKSSSKVAIESKAFTVSVVGVGVYAAWTYRKQIKAGVKKLKAKIRG